MRAPVGVRSIVVAQATEAIKSGSPASCRDGAGKALVHMILMAAMEEGGAGIIGDKVDLGLRKARQAGRVFHQPGHGLVTTPGHLESLPAYRGGCSSPL
ncbi:hypothetical protein GGD83_002773 [Rhodoblastus sphagnicola]|nr:hypothetical protein [Rhodoblastus sphagnicola]MBB4198962.1 hypothetical protein [Rhodoblastus sphagnicola]